MPELRITDLSRNISAVLPANAVLHSLPPGQRWSYEVWVGRERDQGVCITRGPYVAPRIPTPDRLVAPSHRIIEERNDLRGRPLYVEVDYRRDAEEFRAVHCYAWLDDKTAAVVTGQGRVEHFEQTRALAFEIAAGTRWLDSKGGAIH